jgi:hypothetical protein
MEFGCGKISWRESTSTEVQDFSKLPTEFIRIIPETREPDKAAIKDALKAGKEVAGAVLVVKQNIQLK